MPALCIVFWFIIAYPQYFRSSKTSHCRVCSYFNKAFCTNLFCYFFTFFSSALVTPYNRRAYYFTFTIKHNKAMHLARYAKTFYIICIYTRFFYNTGYSFQRSITPVLWFLFCPSIIRCIKRIILACSSYYITIFIKQHCFCRRSSKVNAN